MKNNKNSIGQKQLEFLQETQLIDSLNHQLKI
jgi:hypothetical protein